MKAKDELKILLDSLNEKVEDIELNALIIKEQPESKEALNATQFLEREWSHDGRSGFRLILKSIRDRLCDKPSKQKKDIEIRMEEALHRVQKAITVTGVIFPGVSCKDFVLSCNRCTGLIQMRVFHNGVKNQFEEEQNFVISPSRKVLWQIIEKVIMADTDGVDLGRVHLSAIFKGDQDSMEFRQYIHSCVGLGSKSNHKFILRQYHSPDCSSAKKGKKST